MARACRLGLLLALLLPVAGTSLPGTVVRLNKAVLSYGKRRALASPMGVCMRAHARSQVWDPKSPTRTWILSPVPLCPWPPDKV